MAATKVAQAIIALGTPSPAFAQLTCTSATSRSGTTATASCAIGTLAANDYVLIQNHDLAEYNGIFQIIATGATMGAGGTPGFSYAIKSDPGASSGTTTSMTVDKVVLGTALDMSTDYGAVINGFLQNGNSAPGVAPQVWRGIAMAASAILVDYIWTPFAAGDTTAKSLTPIRDRLSSGVMYVNYAVCRNTTNAVDCCIQASHITAA